MKCRYQDIIDSTLRQFDEQASPELQNILRTHSESVARKALAVCKAHPELGADEELVYAGAMLHDIGIVKCDAPGIHCFGTEPYIKHGVIGEASLMENGKWKMENGLAPDVLAKLGRICARHTGTGLPGLEPETIEEKIVCYADKFFSKTKLDREKTFDEARHSLLKFGEAGVKIFENWHRMMR